MRIYSAVSTASCFFCSGIFMQSVILAAPGSVYWGNMIRHFFGHVSTQPPHCIHRILSMAHVLSSLLTVIALVGHRLEQIPHSIQDSSSIPILPLVLSCHSLGTTGYMSVAGFLNKLFNTTFPMLNEPTALTYLSVQLMQGSIVSTNTGTSARSHPWSILTSAGIFWFVGVRTRILLRNFVPWPLA